MKRLEAALSLSLVVMTACADETTRVPMCQPSALLVLMAQSVQDAALIPCVERLPAGWNYGGGEFRDGASIFWLDSDRAGRRAVQVALSPHCDLSAAREAPSREPEADARRFEWHSAADSERSTWYYVIDGGCVSYEIAFDTRAHPELSVQVEEALGFFTRSSLARWVQREQGRSL